MPWPFRTKLMTTASAAPHVPHWPNGPSELDPVIGARSFRGAGWVAQGDLIKGSKDSGAVVGIAVLVDF